MADVRVQVIGASAERGRVRIAQAEIRRLLGPDALVEDWTVYVDAAERIGITEEQMSDAAATVHAVRNKDAVEAAHVVWLLVPEAESIGCYWEGGIATGLRMGAGPEGRKLLIASGPRVRRTIFTRLFDERHELDSSARDSIARFAAHRARAVTAAE